MDLAALIISFASFGAAAASAVVAWFQRADALKSAERSERAEKAAARSAAQALEAYRAASEALQAMALITGPPWGIQWLRGDAYLLTNLSPAVAYDVHMAVEAGGGSGISGIDLPQDVGARSALKFLFAATLGTGFQRDLNVTWRSAPDGEPTTWSHPIPPKG